MKKIILIILIGILIISTVNAQLVDSPWPTFHGNQQRTGLSPYYTSHLDGTIKWTFGTGAGIESSPAIGEDGTIYVGSHDGYLYAVKDGKEKWKAKIGTPIEKEKYGHLSSTSSTPAIAKDGTIYIASRDQYLFAISSEGKEKWKFPIGISFDSWASPVIGNDGTIYMTSSPPKGGLFAISPDGTEKWHYSCDVGMFNSPAIGKDGTIYVAFPTSHNTNELMAFSPEGTKKWGVVTELFLESTPAISPDGTIYIGSFTDGETGAGLYAISNEKIKWHLTLPTKEVMSTPAIGKDGTIYFGDIDGVFYAINPNGKEKWRFTSGKEIDSSPAIGQDGTIYFGSNNGIFYAFAPDGTEKWRYSTQSSIGSSPAIGKDGAVYIGAWDGKLYAFGPREASKENEESYPEVCKYQGLKTKIDYPFYEDGKKVEYGNEKFVQLVDERSVTKLGQLKGLSCLEFTDFFHSQISGDLTDLSDLVNLKVFSLHTNPEVHGDICAFSKATKLKSLKLAFDTKVYGDISCLKDLNLDTFAMTYTKISGNLSDLSHMTNLKALYLSGTSVEGDIASLSSLINLEELTISDTESYDSKVTGDLASLDNLKKLKKVALYNLDVTNCQHFTEMHPNIEGGCSDESKSTIRSTNIESERIIGKEGVVHIPRGIPKDLHEEPDYSPKEYQEEPKRDYQEEVISEGPEEIVVKKGFFQRMIDWLRNLFK